MRGFRTRGAALVLLMLAMASLGTSATARSQDSDGDGMPNSWERRHGLDPANRADGSRDPDRDRLTNLLEYQHGGDPHNADTDSDSLTDGEEVYRWHSFVDVPNQLIGRVQVGGRCPKSSSHNPCTLRNMFWVGVDVRNRHGKLVAQTRTILNGRFTFQHLEPGHYQVTAVAVAGTSAPAPLDALVPRNAAGPTVASFTLADSNFRGVVGQATQSPTCGGPQRQGEDCIAPLSGATIDVREGDETGPVVASMTTGKDGYYAFQLDPGNYTLVAERYGDSDFPTPPGPASFTVFSDDNGPNLIDSGYDTGIR